MTKYDRRLFDLAHAYIERYLFGYFVRGINRGTVVLTRKEVAPNLKEIVTLHDISIVCLTI
jgi:hypothetical protein